MSKHNNIYNILGKLNALAPQAPKQENILKQLNESAAPLNPLSLKDRLTRQLAETKAVDEELLTPKEKKFAALAEPKNKITYADKIVGAKKDDKKSKKDVVEGEGDVVPDKSWVKHPEDPASKVPAFQRKANEPGRQSAQANVDQMNAKVGAQVFRSGRPTPMEEEMYDENNAHSSLPGTRKVSDQEHSEYDAAAHTVRKWMRKRGWDPKSEFKPALKYVMDNLDSTHDDTLTDDVKTAACTCDKHHQGIVDEGFPTVADAKARAEKERGTGKFDSQKTSTGTRYTRKSDTFSDDDSEEKSTSDGPKKRGRPAKNKGPERVTAKAYKHKGGRVAESINLETYVEDTMAEIEALFITEKAKSKAQQKFMGMVHATQKGEKAPSKEVAKVAKDMGKKDAKDFASTKHKGLPKKVTESVLTESSLQAIVRKFGKEVREFAETGDFDNDLYEALYDYYFDDMPYGVKKARDGDPYEWIGDAFQEAIENGDVEISETKIAGTHKELDELARLAGLSSPVEESGCNMTAEGHTCPVHGLAECGSGMMYEGKKPDFLDVDKDGDEKESFSKALADKEAGDEDLDEGAKPDFLDVDDDGDEKESFKQAVGDAKDGDDKEDLEECGVPVQMGSMPGQSESGMNINTSMDTKTGRKSVTVSAEGEAAEQLAQMLKMAGMTGGAQPQQKHIDVVIGGAHGEESVEEEYANEPNEQVRSTDSIVKQGTDLNRPKRQDPATANRAANPMAEDVAGLKYRLKHLLSK